MAVIRIRSSSFTTTNGPVRRGKIEGTKGLAPSLPQQLAAALVAHSRQLVHHFLVTRPQPTPTETNAFSDYTSRQQLVRHLPPLRDAGVDNSAFPSLSFGVDGV